VKYLMWLLKAALFLTVFAFALNNQGEVQLRLLFGATWQAPLVLVLLVTLGLGVVLGILTMLPLWWRARRQARQPHARGSVSAATPNSPELPPDGI